MLIEILRCVLKPGVYLFCRDKDKEAWSLYLGKGNGVPLDYPNFGYQTGKEIQFADNGWYPEFFSDASHLPPEVRAELYTALIAGGVEVFPDSKEISPEWLSHTGKIIDRYARIFLDSLGLREIADGYAKTFLEVLGLGENQSVKNLPLTGEDGGKI